MIECCTPKESLPFALPSACLESEMVICDDLDLPLVSTDQESLIQADICLYSVVLRG
jgi:hypothetical protein